MRRLLSLLSLILPGLTAHAGVTVDSLDFRGTIPGAQLVISADFAMPFVRAANPRLADDINDALYIGELEAPAPRHPGRRLTPADGIGSIGITRLGFSVVRNDERVLAIAFEGEGCGAYCEDFTSHYNFDLRSGRMVLLNDLLTEPGMRAVAGKMHASGAAAYRAMLAKLTAQLKAERQSKSKVEQGMADDTEARIGLNKQCLEQERSAVAEPDRGGDAPLAYYSDFVLAPAGFALLEGRCSNHAERALDDVGDIVFTLAYAELKPYLTPYGLSLLFNEGEVRPDSGIYGNFLHGTMDGKIAITMRLSRNASHDIEGVYYYDKFRKLIKLHGHEQDGKLELTEEASDVSGRQVEPAVMHLRLQGNRLEGAWVGKAEHQVDLAP